SAASGSGSTSMGPAARPALVSAGASPIPISSAPISWISTGPFGAVTGFVPIKEASLASTSARPGSIFSMRLRTAMALAAKPSRANSSATPTRIGTASRGLTARMSTSASWMRSRGSRLPWWNWLRRSWIAFAYFFLAMRSSIVASFEPENQSRTIGLSFRRGQWRSSIGLVAAVDRGERLERELEREEEGRVRGIERGSHLHDVERGHGKRFHEAAREVEELAAGQTAGHGRARARRAGRIGHVDVDREVDVRDPGEALAGEGHGRVRPRPRELAGGDEADALLPHELELDGVVRARASDQE